MCLGECFGRDGLFSARVGAALSMLPVVVVAEFLEKLLPDSRPPEIKSCLTGWADAIWNQGERFGTIGAQKVDEETGRVRRSPHPVLS